MKQLTFSKFSAIGFIALLTLLHFTNTSVNPNWQPISEYSLGNFGWLMKLAFILLGLSFLSLGVYVLQKLPKVGAKIGGILLLLSSIGVLLAGIFDTDPISTPAENMTTSGQIHTGAAGLLGLMILATIFLTYQFFKQENLRPYKKSILWITIILWVAEVALIGSMGYYLSKTNGMITDETPIGWLGRIVITLCAIWVWICSNNIKKANTLNDK
ncbi:DUF998 domain-containing protein [uncultured Roseivirga sp.]|uniref:DUF998 domain-containing protein n=1 Tax=uncultured Roseivirga sp. TaxID=543088 RepID=UPI0030D7F829|tara:strand:- start:9931 stop:10572 length:642 start_codon:yes stop_codon:yes gene_type:complete